jgi:hypothetical protein
MAMSNNSGHVIQCNLGPLNVITHQDGSDNSKYSLIVKNVTASWGNEDATHQNEFNLNSINLEVEKVCILSWFVFHGLRI